MDVRAERINSPVETVFTEQLKNTAQKNSRSFPTSGKQQTDHSSAGLQQVFKSLTVLGDEIIEKLDRLLAEELPEGTASLAPEDHTPEKTAARIVDGSTALFGIYARQNPKLQGEALIDGFMKEIRKGIGQGYSEAMKVLGELGAFQFEAVESGIEETMRLVEEKLFAFEDNYRKAHGLTRLSDSEKDSENKAEPEPTPPAREIRTTA